MQTEFTIPHHQRKHTLMAIGYGVVLLMWLTPEDATVLIVSILGTGLAALLVLLLLLHWWGGRTLTLYQWLVGLLLVGAVIGFGAVWCTVALMIFKNAWHAHAYPDFSAILITEMVKRLLPWTLAGSLLGGSVGLIRLATSS